MYTEIHYPDELFPEELDDYLANAWFRMGQTIFTCRLIFFDDRLYTTVWLRLCLSGFTFGKSQRKLMRKNRAAFEIVVRKALFDKEKEELYKKHSKRFSGHVSKTLRGSLFGERRKDIYDTYEIAVYEGERLVACSFFDRGEKSLASIMGMFDPEYHKYSLGYYTMLEEMAYGMEHGYEWYYPGYVIPGYKKFDYKLRIGSTEFYDAERGWGWLPIDKLNTEELLSNRLYYHLAGIQVLLRKKGIPHQLWTYPLYDKDFMGYTEGETFLRTPLFISCFPKTMKKGLLIVAYDWKEKKYDLQYVTPLEDSLSLLLPDMLVGFHKDKSFLDFIVLRKTLLSAEDPEMIADAMEKLLY